MGFSTRKPANALLALLLLMAPGLGCVAPGRTAFGYFAAPALTDLWTPKISGWQSREGAVPVDEVLGVTPPVGAGAGSADLRSKYVAYRNERRRALARELATWIQREAKLHYVPDGPLDHWATLQETLDANGDDCDGLELLAYHFLRDLGFPEQEVYRAIVRRPSDGQHHMVTFWFEEPEDPWVLDPTGAMTTGMPRMSDLADWEPVKVFSETEEFSVAPRGRIARVR